jgi:hypothetical protein
MVIVVGVIRPEYGLGSIRSAQCLWCGREPFCVEVPHTCRSIVPANGLEATVDYPKHMLHPIAAVVRLSPQLSHVVIEVQAGYGSFLRCKRCDHDAISSVVIQSEAIDHAIS